MTADALSFVFEVGEQVGGHAQLVQALYREYEAGALSRFSDLAGWQETDWENLLRNADVAIPELFHNGHEGDGSLPTFGGHLKKAFERVYPTQALRGHFDRSASSYPWGEAVREVLNRNPSVDFRFWTDDCGVRR